MPAACYIIGAILLLRFSFNEKEHAEVRKQLDLRSTQRSKVDSATANQESG